MRDEDLIPRSPVLNHGRDQTRARPEPWLVGAGRGLLIGIVAMVAVLVVLRPASLFWFAEEGWSWVRGRTAKSKAEQRLTLTPEVPDDFGLRPQELPNWIGQADYPAEALTANAQGEVVVSWVVARDGQVKSCRIERSSRHASLDDATCRLLRERARYESLDVNGPALRRFRETFIWRLPVGATAMIATPAVAKNEASWISTDDYPPKALRSNQEGTVQLRWTIEPSGRVRDCQIVASSGYAALDRAGCRLLRYRARYAPARDRFGRPVAMTMTRRIVWQLP
jgi:TonB family protein